MTLEQLRRAVGPEVEERIAFYREEMKKNPPASAAIMEEAAFAMDRLLVLPSTFGKRYHVGNPPRWHEVLNDDLEYTCSLNRMGHWKTLIKAYVITGDLQYPARVCEEFADWIKSCPAPPLPDEVADTEPWDSATPWRTLECGIRLVETWQMVMDFLILTPPFTEELLAQMVFSVKQHAEALIKVCPILWPNADHNHYLHENLGLLYAGCTFWWLDEAPEWRTHAINELTRCAQNQFAADGGQVEGCPNYHNVCLGYLCDAVRLMKNSRCFVPPVFHEILQKGMAYSLHSLRPCGQVVQWGDSNSAIDSFVLAAALHYDATGDGLYLHTLARLIGEEALAAELTNCIWRRRGLVPYQPENRCAEETVFLERTNRQAMFRTAWEHDALGLFFGASCLNEHDNGHTHIDPLNFDFSAFGKGLLVDPGHYTYRECAERRMFKSAPYHNCVMIEGREPYEYLSRWRFGPMGHSEITRIMENNRFTGAVGQHACYAPIIHKRVIGIADKALLLALDILEGRSGERAEWFFQMDTTTAALAEASLTAQYGDVVLNAGWECDMQAELLDGFVSEKSDARHPSKRLHLTAPNGKTTFLTVFAPTQGETLPIAQVQTAMEKDGSVSFGFLVDGKPYRGVFCVESNELVLD